METKKIALFTSTGPVGRRLTEEALKRGHSVTAIVRDETEFTLKHPNLKVVRGDVGKKEDVSRYARGNDVAIYEQEVKQKAEGDHLNTISSVLGGVKDAGIQHLVVSGHTVSRPTELTQEEYNSWKPFQEEQLSALSLLEREPELQWSYTYTPRSEPDKKTERFMVGKNFVIATPEGENTLPTEEFTSAILDEAEKSENVELEHR